MKALQSHSQTVLLVEDDMLLSLVGERMITKMGYHVVGKALSGPEAIEKTKALNPDIIMMDISLKGDMDGIEAVSEIRKFSDIPVIYLSGSTDKLSMERAKKTSYVDYLMKPVTEVDLAEPLKRATSLRSKKIA
ncbi:MAG: response regulator [Balneolaceae bacterium]